MTSQTILEVSHAAARIVTYFGSHNKVSYFECFSESATFVFYTHNEVLENRQAYEFLWDKWEAEDGFRVLSCSSKNGQVQVLSDSVAIFTHQVESSINFGNDATTVHERETIVFLRVAGEWKAVHEHLSPVSDNLE